MEGLFCKPCSTVVNALDPAPPRAPSSEMQAPGSVFGVSIDTPPGTSSSGSTTEILQEVSLHFKIQVKQVNFTVHDDVVLGLSAKDCFSCHTSQLTVEQRDAALRKRLWRVRFKPTADSCVIEASDGGPRFSTPQLEELVVCTRQQYERVDSSAIPRRVEVVHEPDDRDVLGQNWSFEIDHAWNSYVVLSFTLVTKRRVARAQWNRLRYKKDPEPKSLLLDSSKETGDIILVGGEGVEAAAHSAVLVAVPYFEAKLREEWSGTRAWNLHNKLRLRLPCHAGAETLRLFLHCVYGDLRPLLEVIPESLLLQDVLSLADACNVPALCADIVKLVEVTSANVELWLQWLLDDHGLDAEPIRRQVAQVMRAQFQDALQEDRPLTAEQLAGISRHLPRRRQPCASESRADN